MTKPSIDATAPRLRRHRDLAVRGGDRRGRGEGFAREGEEDLRRAHGASLDEHGIWGAPAQVIERIERHRALGCTFLPIEFFGREPARLFAESVMPAFAG